MQAVGNSIVKAVSDGILILITTLTTFHQEMSIRDLGIEFDKLESTESVDSAQAATATSYKDWLDTESVDVSVQKDLSYLFSSDRARKEKLKDEEAQKAQKAQKAFEVYYQRGESRKSDHQVNLMQFF